MLGNVGTAFTVAGNNLLAGISGFAALTDVGGAVTISNNPALATVTGLSALADVGTHLELAHNNALTQFDSVNSLVSVGNDLRVSRNPVLTSIAGLNSGTLQSASGVFNISANPGLSSCQVDKLRTSLAVPAQNDRSCCNSGCTTCVQPAATCSAGSGSLSGQSGVYLGNLDAKVAADLNAFSRATQITGELTINGSNVLNLSGLASLTRVTSDFTISNNTTLQNVSALSALTNVGGILSISNNAALTSLAGLSALTAVGGNLDIQSHPALTTVGMTALETIGGRLYFYNNNNAAMTTLDFTSLDRVAQLYIYANQNLTNLDAIRNGVSYVGTTSNNGAVTIQSNANLSTCAVSALISKLQMAPISWTGTPTNTSNKVCAGTCNVAVCQ
jgi:hypothetical protein